MLEIHKKIYNPKGDAIKKIVKVVYTISLIGVFLSTFNFKCFWEVPIFVFLIINILCLLLYMLIIPLQISSKDIIIVMVMFTFLSLHVFSNKGIGLLGIAAEFICMVGVLLIGTKDQAYIFEWLITVYAAICFISLVGWIMVCVLHVNIPMSYSQYAHYRFYDYGIFNIRVEGVAFSRYLGMFLEPGYTGVMCVLLLVLNGFNLKKPVNIVLLISALFTLSLAAYLLIGIYFSLYRFTWKKIAIIVAVLLVSIVVVQLLYRQSPLGVIIDQYLISRIDRMLSGNVLGNRFSRDFNAYFNRTILRDPWNFMFGVGSVELSRQNLDAAGFKVFIAQDGILNTAVAVVLYYLLSHGYQFASKRFQLNNGYLVFFVWLFSFIDIAYPTWACFIIVMICGPAHMYAKQYPSTACTSKINVMGGVKT